MNPTPPNALFPAGRLMAMDAYRGFVMLLMMAEVLNLERVARRVPESRFWQFLGHHQSHVEWFGCSLHDLIQPSFSFLVGVALPYSLAGQLAKGTAGGALWLRTIRRALVLIFLGIFLRSVGAEMTNFTFEDTLTQIGLGYPLLVAFGLGSERGYLVGLRGGGAGVLARVCALSAARPRLRLRGRGGYPPTGLTTAMGWRRISIKTATWPGRSIPGF
jgi:hypothetical protein